MHGEELPELFAGFAGVYGDRIFAFKSSASRAGFPYLTARVQPEMLRYRPRFRYPERAARPINFAEAEPQSFVDPPIYAEPDELLVDVETPSGETFAIDHPALIERLRESLDARHEVSLMRSGRALADCRPISIFSVQSAHALSGETGIATDKRRFRANVYLDLSATNGFAEDAFVGRRLRIGKTATIAVLERDRRCMMINLDPDTTASSPAVLKNVAQAHDGAVGVYGAVIFEGMIRQGDAVELLD